MAEQQFTFKHTSQEDLTLSVCSPDVITSPVCVVFYFGGGFVKKHPDHFRPQAEALARLGYRSVLVNYRVASHPEVFLEDCYADARDGFQYLIDHHAELGIDPQALVAAGGSAGGALAASLSTFNQASQMPLANVLFNPALYHGKTPFAEIAKPTATVFINDAHVPMDQVSGFRDQYGQRYHQNPEQFSNTHHLQAGMGPTIIFQGTYDEIVYEGVICYTQKARELGNRVELVLYPEMKHGFFNRGRSDNDWCYDDTFNRMVAFL